jgi:hypothetical protein
VIPYGYFEIGCEYVGQFGSVTVATSCETFLLVVIVVGSTQMAENEFRRPYLFFFVFDNRHAFAIVVYNESLFIDMDSDIGGLSSAYVVRCVDKNFVEDFVEGWYDLQFSTVDIGIVPCYRFYGTNVGVRA